MKRFILLWIASNDCFRLAVIFRHLCSTFCTPKISSSKSWAIIPIVENIKTYNGVFNTKNENFCYGIYSIKMFVSIQCNFWKHFCETFICWNSRYGQKTSFHVLRHCSITLVRTNTITRAIKCVLQSTLRFCVYRISCNFVVKFRSATADNFIMISLLIMYVFYISGKGKEYIIIKSNINIKIWYIHVVVKKMVPFN